MIEGKHSLAQTPIHPLPHRAGSDGGRRLRGAAVLGLVVAAIAGATIATVWAIERAGYVPCELCLAERDPFYAAVPLALLTGWAASADRRGVAAAGFWLLAVTFLASAGLAAYHAGVEWKLWAGPTGCSGPMTVPTSTADFLAALKTVKIVRCDAPALVVLGLSLAAWNVLLSLLLAAVSARAAWSTRRVPIAASISSAFSVP